jgi:outer membrane protein assembly factor BamD (BamD/ComL family)
MGTPADDLYNKGVAEMANEKWDAAAKDYEAIVTGYPTGAHVDDARISAGYAHLRANEYPEAIAILAKQAADPTKPQYRATALYFTSLAQFTEGQKEKDPTKAHDYFKQAVGSLTSLIELCSTAPTPENKGYLEPSIYYRALAQFLRDDFDDSEKDLLQLLKQFPASRSRPDYWVRLGSVYMTETNQAVTDKKSSDEIVARAQKAIDAFDHVSTDPNALVQANDANMSKGEILFMIAQIDSTAAGYKKALDAYRQVRRKDDMIALQQSRIDQLKQQIAKVLSTALASYSNEDSLLIEREESRLTELKNGPDPIILALIRMAECYVNMKQPDEARTILHRLAHASLPPEQQQEVDFQTLYSYVLGGQTDQADKALTDYLAKHGTDPQASSISYQIAAKLLERKDYPAALAQALRSLKDFPPPKGKYWEDATALEAQILTQMKRIPESNKIVDDFLKANPSSPKAINLLLTRAQNEAESKNFDAALADFKTVKDNAAASPELRSAGYAGYIQTLHSLKKYDDVIAEAKNYATQYPKGRALSSVLLFSALSMAEKHDPAAVAALQDIAKTYPTDAAAPFALFTIIKIYQQGNNVPGMIQAANDLRKAFPEAYPFLIQAKHNVAMLRGMAVSYRAD